MSFKDWRVVVLAVLVFGASLSLVAYWVSSGTSNHRAGHTQAQPESRSLKQDLHEITHSEENRQLLDSVREGTPRLEPDDVRVLKDAEVISAEEARLLEEIEKDNVLSDEKKPMKSKELRDKGGQ